MSAQGINCPNCGAPLTMMTKQELVICVYCNSSVRVEIQKDKPVVITKVAEITAEVIDEVKRLIIMSNTPKAIEYYSQQSGVTPSEANIAIEALKKTIGYRPALNKFGLFSLFGLLTISVIITLLGAWLMITLSGLFAFLILIGIVFFYMNWHAFNSSLKAYYLTKNGIVADAKILKRWDIKTYPATSKRPETTLIRLLVEVKAEGKSTYQAETNCLLGEQSRLKYQPGSAIQIKYDKKDPMKIVIAKYVD